MDNRFEDCFIFRLIEINSHRPASPWKIGQKNSMKSNPRGNTLEDRDVDDGPIRFVVRCHFHPEWSLFHEFAIHIPSHSLYNTRHSNPIGT